MGNLSNKDDHKLRCRSDEDYHKMSDQSDKIVPIRQKGIETKLTKDLQPY